MEPRSEENIKAKEECVRVLQQIYVFQIISHMKWEAFYQVEEVTLMGAYILKSIQGIIESMSSNAFHLKKYSFWCGG